MMKSLLTSPLLSKVMLLALAGTMLTPSCTTNPYTGEEQISKTALGAVLAGAAGAGIGALTGDNSKERRQRALIGAGIGALAGGAVGGYMDSQEARLRRELRSTGVSVTRRGQHVILNMPGNVTFATSSATISGDFYPVLNSVAKVLQEFNKTIIDVAGHTDSTGSRDYNLQLSRDRAVSVADYLSARGVASGRFSVTGYGPDYPIADNESADGKRQNRRVEITLQPLTQ